MMSEQLPVVDVWRVIISMIAYSETSRDVVHILRNTLLSDPTVQEVSRMSKVVYVS